MAEQIYLKLDDLENYKQDLFKRLDEAVNQFYNVDRLFKQMDDYLYDEGLSNEFYFSYTSQNQKIDNLHGKLWTLTNNIVKIYHEASETIDKPFKKNMEQFAERLSLVDINRHSVKTSGIAVQGESWQAGDSISAPSTAYATFTTKNSVDFTDLMNSSFTRKMKQEQYQAFLAMSGQLDFQVNYETFVNTLYRQTDFNYETGVEKVTNILSTGLVIVCVGGLVVMSGGALAGLAVPGWIGTTTMVAGGVLSAQNLGYAITGLDINGNPLSQKEREAYILSAGTDIAFMIAGFGLNKILKNANKLGQVDELSVITDGTPDELARINNISPFEDGLQIKNRKSNQGFFESGSEKLPPLENAPYIKNGKPNGRPSLSGNAKLEFEQAVYNRQVSPDGILRDPNPPFEIIDWKPGDPRKDVVDFGHLQGESYNDMFLKYKNRDITLDELKEFQFNPDNFQIEIPSKNRGHKFE